MFDEEHNVGDDVIMHSGDTPFLRFFFSFLVLSFFFYSLVFLYSVHTDDDSV